MQVHNVRDDGIHHRAMFMVYDARTFANLPGEDTDRRIVNMADARKQMMLDLEIESSK